MIIADTNNNDTANRLSFALFDMIKEGAAVVEVATKKIVYCNRSFLRLFGLDELTDPDSIDFRKLRKEKLTVAEIAEREKLINEKGFFSEVVEYSPANGNCFFGEVFIQYFCCDHTDYYLFTINPVDKAFFELASMGILMVNHQGVIVTANPFVIKQFGFEKNELIGKKIELLLPSRFHHHHVKQREAFVHNPIDRPLGIGMDLLGIRKDGSEFPVEVSLGHYPSDGDKYIIAFISDISIRKNAEAESKKLHKELESTVEQRTRALRETLRQLEVSRTELQKLNIFQKALFDSAGAMIISIDANGIIQTFNPEAEKELGYTATELIGKHTPMVFHDPLVVMKRAQELSKELQKEIPADISMFFEKAKLGMLNEDDWVYVRKDGTKFPARLSIAPMKDEQGIIEGYVGVAFDISKTK
ncbi:MAG: PAS domain S-box protein [Chitinophagaceae bacterium]|nr:PAS domain S-box protein [Chitinophagaceae bacterium]